MSAGAQYLFVCQDGAAPSGVATYGYHLLAHERGAGLLLLNLEQPPPGCAKEFANRVGTVPPAQSHQTGAVAAALAAAVARTSGEVTILPNTGDTPWAATAEFLRTADAATRARVRVLGIVHSDMETQYALAEHHHAFAPVWIGVSRRCADELRRRLTGRDVAVHELPYPIALPPEPVRAPGGPLRLAYVGRLEEPQKRVSRLVPLFEELVRRGVDFQATIVGDGPAAPELKAALGGASPAVRSRVRLAGALPHGEIASVWAAHDVALLVSAYEGLPLALLEAMAAGVCPVAMAVDSGLPDLLTDGANARVVPPGDVGAMAGALVTLAGNRAELAALGRAARATVATRFSPAPHFARLAGIVRELHARSAPCVAGETRDPTAAAVAELVDRAKRAARPVAVFGAGMIGRKVLDGLFDAGVPVAAWFDSDPACAGREYRGLRCAAAERVTDLADAVFVAGSLQFQNEMAARIAAEFHRGGLSNPMVIGVSA